MSSYSPLSKGKNKSHMVLRHFEHNKNKRNLFKYVFLLHYMMPAFICLFMQLHLFSIGLAYLCLHQLLIEYSLALFSFILGSPVRHHQAVPISSSDEPLVEQQRNPVSTNLGMHLSFTHATFTHVISFIILQLFTHQSPY